MNRIITLSEQSESKGGDNQMKEANQKADCTILYSYLAEKLSKGGITREEIAAIKDNPIGHQSVEGFIAINLQLGNFYWRGNKLVNTDRKFVLGLSRTEEECLRYKAAASGQSETEYINEVLVQALLNS